MSSRLLMPPSASTGSIPARLFTLLLTLSLGFGASGASFTQSQAALTNPSNALWQYVQAPDPHYSFQIVGVETTPLLKRYTIRMRSQAWNPGGLVLNRTVWEHGMALVAPRLSGSNTALLFINGGSNEGALVGQDEVQLATQAALRTGSAVAVLFQVPNQPLRFADEPFDHTEDELVAYSWDKAMDTADYSWPIYLPMVKSAVKAMDTVQTVLPQIKRFVVTGFSKRGAATWLTAAVDPRVKAIAPGVFDVLNFSAQAKHHVKVYGCFAPALEDYNEYRIFQRIATPAGAALRTVVDPYAYLDRPRYRERLSLPKYLINSSGDQFFVPDSAQFYWTVLPPEKHIRYVPNSDHSLSNSPAVLTNTLAGLLGWYRSVLFNARRPPVSWSFDEGGALVVRTSSQASTARLWQATNPAARDFRLETTGSVWTSRVLRKTVDGVYKVRVLPANAGWRAYFVEVTYPGAVAQIYSTRVFVTPDRPRPFEQLGIAQAGLCSQ